PCRARRTKSQRATWASAVTFRNPAACARCWQLLPRRSTNSVIQLSNLSKSFGERVLLDAVTWQIDDGERVGLCGPNGAGKTTLLRMMAGLEGTERGATVRPATLTGGYLPQGSLSHSGRPVFEEASSAFAELMAMKAEMHALEERLGDPSIPESDHEAMLGRSRGVQGGSRVG